MYKDYLNLKQLPKLLELMDKYDDIHAHRAFRCYIKICSVGIRFIDEYGNVSKSFDTIDELINWLTNKDDK